MKILSLEETSDVKIICEEKEFKCHRAILCVRSETFKKMLLGETDILYLGGGGQTS